MRLASDSASVGSALPTLTLVLLTLVATPTLAIETGRPMVRPDSGFIDATYDLDKIDYREGAAVQFGESLFVAWTSKEQNPDVPVNPGSPTALSRHVYVRELILKDGQWSPKPHVVEHSRIGALPTDPWLLTPGSLDPVGNGNHQPILVTFSGKLLVFWQSGDPGILPGRGTGSDILYSTFQGDEWSVPQVANEEDGTSTEPFDDLNVDAIVYDGQLCISYDRNRGALTEVYLRCLDSAGVWGASTRLSAPANETFDQFPTLAVFGDSLAVTWCRTSRGGGFAEVHVRLFDGTRWGPVQVVDHRETTDRQIIPRPRMATVEAGQAGLQQRTLFLSYTTLGGIATRKVLIDDDVVVRRYDGASWDNGTSLSPPGDSGPDGNAALTLAADGYLYAAWETQDDGTAQGKDVDVVYRIFNATLGGSGWSPTIYQASRPGDREDFTPDGEHTYGDDDLARMFVYQNRVMTLFRTFDPITGRLDHSDIVLRFLSDYDNDHDGFSDSVDACPGDPSEHRDSDSDGVCDGKDDCPSNPLCSVRPPIEAPPTLTWFSSLLVIAVLIGMVVVLLAMSAANRRASRALDGKGSGGTDKAPAKKGATGPKGQQATAKPGASGTKPASDKPGKKPGPKA